MWLVFDSFQNNEVCLAPWNALRCTNPCSCVSLCTYKRVSSHASSVCVCVYLQAAVSPLDVEPEAADRLLSMSIRAVRARAFVLANHAKRLATVSAD